FRKWLVDTDTRINEEDAAMAEASTAPSRAEGALAAHVSAPAIFAVMTARKTISAADAKVTARATGAAAPIAKIPIRAISRADMAVTKARADLAMPIGVTAELTKAIMNAGTEKIGVPATLAAIRARPGTA